MDIYTCVAICFAVVGAIVVLALFSDVGDAVIRKKLHLPPALKEPNVKDKLIEYILNNKDKSTSGWYTEYTVPDKKFLISNKVSNITISNCSYPVKEIINIPGYVSIIIGKCKIISNIKDVDIDIKIIDDMIEFNHIYSIPLKDNQNKIVVLDDLLDEYREESTKWSNEY